MVADTQVETLTQKKARMEAERNARLTLATQNIQAAQIQQVQAEVSTPIIEAQKTLSQTQTNITELSDEEILRLAKSRGLKVDEKIKWDQHTFNITVQSKKEFFKAQKASGMSIQDAHEEAIVDWLKKKQGQKNSFNQ